MPNILDTCIIVATPQSSATEEIHLFPLRRQAMIFWQSCDYSTHSVRRRDMVRLLMDLRQSAGQWVNRYALPQRHIILTPRF